MSIDAVAPVIAGVDGSPAGYRAADWAAREAQSQGRALVLLSVNTWPSCIGAAWLGAQHRDVQSEDARRWDAQSWDVDVGRSVCRDVLHQARAGAEAQVPELDVRTDIVDGQPSRVLLERSLNAALIVVGRRGGGEFSRLLLGSTAAQVATHAECPVVVVPEALPTPTGGGPGVVVGVDIGEHAQEAVGFAFDQASRRKLPLTAVRAWTLLSEEPAIRNVAPNPQQLESEQRRLLSEALAGWCTKYPDVPVEHWLIRRHAGQALVGASQGASLLVVGARGSGGFPGLRLGSVGDAAIRHADCPVAVAR
jgi:nucleotide-binding universal stress UspA family protein